MRYGLEESCSCCLVRGPGRRPWVFFIFISMDQKDAPRHYAGLAVQPSEIALKNKLNFHEGNVIKYICRWRQKGGLADLEKAKSYIDDLIAFEKQTIEVYRPETYQDLERRPTPAYNPEQR